MRVPGGALAAVFDVLVGVSVECVPRDRDGLAEKAERDGALDRFLDAIARLADAGDLLGVLV